MSALWVRFVFRCNSVCYSTTYLVRNRHKFHQGGNGLVGVHPRPSHNDGTHVHDDHGDLARPTPVGTDRDVRGPGVRKGCDAECPDCYRAEYVAQQDTPLPEHLPFDSTRRGFNGRRGYYFFFRFRAWKSSSAWCFRISSSDRIDSGHCWYTP